MSIQVYESKDKELDNTSGALVVLPNGQQITEEEHEKRIKDAEELEKKLQFITEKVPTRIMNVAGSNAGAGSGEFHMYRMARRREMMRLQRIEEQDRESAAQKEHEERKRQLLAEDEARTAKRRAKRMKKKGRKKPRAGADGGNETGDAAARAGDSSDASDEVPQAALD